MSCSMKGPSAAGSAQAEAAFVSHSSYTAASLLVHLTRQIREEIADDSRRCGDTDCGALAGYAEWVGLKLQDELTSLGNAVKAAGWVQD